MPYIKTSKRYELDNELVSVKSSGELNYKITMLVKNYIDNKGQCYDTLNEVIGVLECAKLELYRRKIANYENEKIKENGDVY